MNRYAAQVAIGAVSGALAILLAEWMRRNWLQGRGAPWS